MMMMMTQNTPFECSGGCPTCSEVIKVRENVDVVLCKCPFHSHTGIFRLADCYGLVSPEIEFLCKLLYNCSVVQRCLPPKLINSHPSSRLMFSKLYVRVAIDTQPLF